MYNVSIEFRHAEPLQMKLEDKAAQEIKPLLINGKAWLNLQEKDGMDWLIKTDEIVTINMIGDSD